MPFISSVPRAFSIRSVRTHAPSAPGIYGLSNARQWIYIAQTDDIQGALLDHLSHPNGFITHLAPTGFAFELCDTCLQPSRQDQLILEYQPTVNPFRRD